MIKRYKNISIQKISDHGGQAKTPTHRIVVAEDDYKNKQGVGKLWTKESQYGKFLSGQLDKNWTTQDGKEFSGYSIVSDEALDELEKTLAELLITPDDYPKNEHDEEIPF